MDIVEKTKAGRLDDKQVAFYREQGYLIYPEAVFPEVKFLKLKTHFEAKLASLPSGERPEGMDVPHFTDPRFSNGC